MSTENTSQKHPFGLYILFFTEMWERFSYYGMRAILLLFMTKAATEGGMALPEAEGSAIYGLYTSSVYLLCLLGGWIADRLIGQKKSILYGGIIIMIGHLILAIPSAPSVFFAGLAVVALGTGFLKPNISALVGELYPEGGARRDAAFSIFYMGINLGSFIGMIVVGYLGQKVDWHLGFGAAAVAMLLGLVVFHFAGRTHLKEVGNAPKAQKEVQEGATRKNLGMITAFVSVSIGILSLLNYMGKIDLSTAKGIAEGAGVIIVVVSVAYFAFIFLAGGLDIIEKKRVAVMFVLFLAAALFWSGFEQAGSSLTIFADKHTDNNFWGWVMPSSWYQSFNGIFIVILAPFVAALWINLAKRNLSPNTPAKFALGLIFMGLGFLVMVFAAKIAVTGKLASMAWLSITYLLHTVGELCLSPVGLSTFTKLSPKRFLSQFMGIWFVAASLGNLIAGLFAGGFNAGNLQEMPNLFMSIVYFGIGVGLVLLILSKPIKKWMGGIQ